MNNVRIQIGNQLYDEIEVKLKNVMKEKEYISGNQLRWANSRVIINLKVRNMPKIIL
jgi:hypothetical protein